MSATRITVLGIGSVRHAPAIIGSFATFFGERPLDICFYDADEERLDLFDRFARVAFIANKNKHGLRSTSEPEEALEDATHVILCLEENCARKMLTNKRASVQDGVSYLMPLVPAAASMLNLISEDLDLGDREALFLNWPPEVSEIEKPKIPHQVLRWIYQDEYLHDFFKAHASTPLKSWLDNPLFSLS